MMISGSCGIDVAGHGHSRSADADWRPPIRFWRNFASRFVDDRNTGAGFSAIMTLAIECPFRTSRHLNAAVDVMELFKTDTVIGVRPETDHFYQHKGAGLEPVRQNIHLRLEREELYREVAGLRLIRRPLCLRMRASPAAVGHVVIDQRGALGRSSFDWIVAAHLASET